MIFYYCRSLECDAIMLTPMDDTLWHTLPTTFDHVGTSDPRFFDRYWFAASDPAGGGTLQLTLGVYNNMNVVDAGFVAIRDGRQHNLRASRSLRPRFEPVCGPLRVEELVADADSFAALMSQALGYPQTNGTVELRSAIAAMYPGATPDHVEVTNGGSEANRMRFIPEITEAVRAHWPDHKPLFVRLSVEDNAGWGPEQSARLAKILKAEGVDVIVELLIVDERLDGGRTPDLAIEAELLRARAETGPTQEMSDRLVDRGHLWRLRLHV